MKIEGLSASSYSTYSWCNWKWVLQYILKFREPSGVAALGGTIAHKVLEIMSIWRVAKGDLDNAELQKECLEIAHNFDFSRVTDQSYLWEACFNYYASKEPDAAAALLDKHRPKVKSIKAGIEWLVADIHDPLRAPTIHAEHAFEIPLVGPQWTVSVLPDGNFQYLTLRGKIDRVDDHGGGVLEIVDYKTGKSTHWPPQKGKTGDKTLDDFYDDIQCLIYYFAVKKFYPKAKSVIVTFIFVAEQKKFSVTLSEHDVEHMKQKILARFIEVQKLTDPVKSTGFWCKHICHFGKSGICQKVWNEKEMFGMDFVKDYYVELNRS